MARPSLSDSEILQQLYSELEDPDRNPTFTSELEKEIRLVEGRVAKGGGQLPPKPQSVSLPIEPRSFENKNPGDNSPDLMEEFGIQLGTSDLLDEFGIDSASLESAGPTMKDRLGAAGENVRFLLDPTKSTRDEGTLETLPGRVVPGTSRMIADISATADDTLQIQLNHLQGLIQRIGTANPPTAPEMDIVVSAKHRHYLTQALLAGGDQAKITPILTTIQDEIAEAAKGSRIARDVSSSYTADLKAMGPEDPGFVSQAMISAAESIGPSLGAAALSAINPMAGIAAGAGFMTLAGQGSANLKAEEIAKERGVELTPEHRLRFAGLQGIFEGVGEAVGLKIALKVGLPFFERVAKAIVGESTSEGATALMQKAHEYLAINPDMTAEEFAYEVALSAAAGAFGGTAIATAAGGIQKVGETVSEDRAIQDAFDDLMASENIDLPSPEEMARKSLDPGAAMTPEESFRFNLKTNPLKAAEDAHDLMLPGQEGELTPGQIAKEMNDAGEISDAQYELFRRSMVRSAVNRYEQEGAVEIGKLEPEAQGLEKHLTEMGEAPIDHKPTRQEAVDLDFAMEILKIATAQNLDQVSAWRYASKRIDLKLREDLNTVGKASPLLLAWRQMFSDSPQGSGLHGQGVYEGVDFAPFGEGNSVKYLAVMAARQAQGFYPFSSTFAGYNGRQEDGENLVWTQADGSPIHPEETSDGGFGRGMARMADGQRATATAALITRWLQAIAPNARVMVVDSKNVSPFGNTSGAGWSRTTGENSAIMWVDETLDDASYTEVLAHEFGHFLVKHFLAKMPKSVRQALNREFGRANYKLMHQSVVDAIRQDRGPHGNTYTPGSAYVGTVADNITNPFVRGYLFGKEEWAAHQMERMLASNKLGMRDAAETFFKKLMVYLKRFFDRFGSDFAPNKVFEDFIRLGSLRERQKAMRNSSLGMAEQMLRDYGINELTNAELLDASQFLATTLRNIRAGPKITEALQQAGPELQNRAAAAIKNLGQNETEMFFPMANAPVEPTISAEEMVMTLEDAWLPGQSTNTLREALSSSTESSNSGMPRSRPASRIASALKNYFKYSAFGKMVDSSPYEGHLDKYSWMRKQVHSLENWAKANPHIDQLQRYLKGVREWARDRMAWIHRADARLKEWRKLTTSEQKVLGRFMLDQTYEGKFFDLNDPIVLQKYPLTPAAREMYNKINSDFQDFISAVEATLVTQASKRLMANPFGAAAEMQRIKDRFNQLRTKPYFPLSRFGEHIISVKATKLTQVHGKTYQPGEVMHFETFDTKFSLMAELDRIKGAYPTGDLKIDQISEDIASLMGMPIPILEALKTNKDIALTDAQKKALDEYMYKHAPGQSFVKHLIHRKGVEGYTEDVQRAYANYFFHGASHLARIKHSEALSEEIKATHLTADLIATDSSKRRAIANYMARHFSHIMAPENDWAGIRANVAVAYLAGVMKTAFVNLTQVPLVTYPHLAAKFGDVQALRAIQKAYTDTAAMYHVSKTLTKAEEEAITRWSQGVPLQPGDEKIVKHWSKLAPTERNMLRQAVAEGWIDESMAMELAAMSEGSWLTRFKATSKAGYYWRSFQFYSMIPFQAAEKLNRRVTAIAAFRLAEAKGGTYEQAYEAAREAVSASQYEYAKWNRAELLRGKKGIFFMFWQYMLNTLYFAFGGDKGWWRWWLLMLAAAGPLGLPFAENLKDLATWVGQKLAGPNTRFNADYEIKKAMGELGEMLGLHPDLLMHGISRYGFGLIPFADLSGSLSMGRPIPFTELMASPGNDWKTIVTQSISEAGGATTSLGMRMLQAAVADDVDSLRRVERGMPITFAQHMLAMGRWYRDGAVESSTGADLVKFDTNDPWHLAELAGKTLGFTPERVNAAREEHFLKQDFTNFYRLRRQMLFGKLDHEMEKGDNQSTGEVIEAIRAFNKEVPSGSLAITSQQIRSMRLNREKARTLTEQGVASQPMYQDLQQGVGERRY